MPSTPGVSEDWIAIATPETSVTMATSGRDDSVPTPHESVANITPNQQGVHFKLSSYDTDSSDVNIVGPFTTDTPAKKCCLSCSPRIIKNALKVKPKFIPCKLTYFFFFAARSIFYAYYMIYLTHVGLDPKQAGLIQGLRLLVVTVSAFLWGYVADRSRRPLLIIFVQVIIGTVFVILIPLVAALIRETEEEHKSHSHILVPSVIAANASNASGLVPAGSRAADSKVIPYPHYPAGRTDMFLAMLGLGLGSAFFGGGTQVLIDSFILTFTRNESTSKNAFGRQRLWGSIAYAVCPLICGILTEALYYQLSPFLVVFVMFFLMKACLLVCFTILLRQSQVLSQDRPKPTPDTSSSNVSSDAPPSEASETPITMWMTLKQVKTVVFLFIVLVLGVANGIQWHFVFMFIEEMGGTKIMIGLIVFAQCGIETFVLPSASKISQLLRGNNSSMMVGVFGYSLAFGLYYFTYDPRIMVLISTLVGLSFATFYTAATDELYQVCSMDNINKFMGVYNAVYGGVGSATAGMVGGTIYKAYGPRILYLTSSMVLLAIGIILSLYFFIKNWRAQALFNTEPVLSSPRKASTIGDVMNLDGMSVFSMTVLDYEDLKTAAV